jgi:hypothetical protein
MKGIYLAENGITIKCQKVKPGYKQVVNGKEYEVVDREMLLNKINSNSDLSSICVSLVNDMSCIFKNRNIKSDIMSWDMSNVTDTSFMFYGSNFNQEIDIWDVSHVINMSFMFYNSSFNKNLNSWDVSNVVDMRFMFAQSSLNKIDFISNWSYNKDVDKNSMLKGLSLQEKTEIADKNKKKKSVKIPKQDNKGTKKLKYFLLLLLLAFLFTIVRGIIREQNAIYYYRDKDGDGYGDIDDRLKVYKNPPIGYVKNNDDPDDTNPCIPDFSSEKCSIMLKNFIVKFLEAEDERLFLNIKDFYNFPVANHYGSRNIEESKLKSIYTSIWAKQYSSQNKLISLTVIDKDEVEFITEFSRQNKSYSEMSKTKSTVRLKLYNGKINEIGVRK